MSEVEHIAAVKDPASLPINLTTCCKKIGFADTTTMTRSSYYVPSSIVVSSPGQCDRAVELEECLVNLVPNFWRPDRERRRENRGHSLSLKVDCEMQGELSQGAGVT